MPARDERFPRILWKYGQSMGALRYAVGRECSLPCSKRRVRECLLAAITLAHDADDAAALVWLRAGYVQLEAFVTDTEFEIVRASRNAMGDKATPAQSGAFFRIVRQLAACAERAETPAMAILTRIAEQMLVRQREIARSR